MKHVLPLTVLLWMSTPSNVNCGLWDRAYDLKNWIFGSPARVANESSLILTVESSGLCYMANYEFITNHVSGIYSKFLFACPPEPGSPEESLNEEISKTKNALFIQKTYDRPKNPGRTIEIINHNCHKPVKPSFINIGHYESDPDLDLFLVGYEIFLGEDIKLYKISDFDAADLKDERFAWFHIYTIAFDRIKRRVVSVFNHTLSYNHFEGAEITSVSIRDSSEEHQAAREENNLGVETFYPPDFEISDFYGWINQAYVFDELFGENPTSLNYVDRDQRRILGEVYLAPLDSLGIPVLSQAGKTFGNIAPMWSMVYDGAWWIVERHVEYLAKGVKAIHVVTGTYGTLQLSGKEIYLVPNYMVDVPAVFFKIVSYSPFQNTIYSMVVVTSNNPYDETDGTDELICKLNQCEQFGWNKVQQDFFAMGRTSCCELTKEVLKELKMEQYERYIDKTLDLNVVPHWRVEHLTLNMKAYIEDRINGKNLQLEADNVLYRNEPDVGVNASERDDEFTISKFISIIYDTYISPYFAKKSDYLKTN